MLYPLSYEGRGVSLPASNPASRGWRATLVVVSEHLSTSDLPSCERGPSAPSA
jgi:hypothetical protein